MIPSVSRASLTLAGMVGFSTNRAGRDKDVKSSSLLQKQCKMCQIETHKNILMAFKRKTGVQICMIH